MAHYYLLDAETITEGVKLIYFNTQTGDFEEIVDGDYSLKPPEKWWHLPQNSGE